MRSGIFFILLLPLSLFAQKTSVTGKVTDEKGYPLAFINVVLRQTNDSSIVKAAATLSDGSFLLENLSAGMYFLQYTYIGFEEIETTPFTLAENERREMEVQQMRAKTASLNEVEVVYTRPLVEVKADRTIFNVEGTTNSIGLNALELLRKAPGVLVDNNDNILVKGKAGITVYIDGKITPLDSDGLAQMLKNMQSNMIESIEIITNPSAKYDAAGHAGIINIKLKKNKNFGTNGTLTLGFGTQRYTKYNSGVTLNHRNNKWNLFANYGNNIGNYWDYMTESRIQNSLSFEQKMDNIRGGIRNNFKGGMDYTINSKNTVGIMLSGNINKNISESISKTMIGMKGISDTDSVLIAYNQSEASRNNLNYNLNYRYADTSGYELGIDADFGDYRISNNTYQPNTYFDAGENSVLNSNNYLNNTTTDIRIASLKGDYEQNLWKGKLSAGFKFSNVNTKNRLSFYTIEGSGSFIDTTRSNSFDYNESISAVYISFSKDYGKWGIQSGVRSEHTISKGKLTAMNRQSNTEVDREYLNFFPSASLTYHQKDNSVFSLTYSRRIDRPSYQDLNPFEYRIDELSYERGNAFLKPQYTNNFELSHTYLYMLNTSVSYSHTNGFFTEVNDTTGLAASYTQTRNLGYQDYYGININSPIPVSKWWNMYINFDIYQVNNHADFGNDKKVDLRVTSYNCYMQQTFTIAEKWNLELSGWYDGPGIWGATYKNSPMGGVDIALKKELFGNKASIRMAYGDLFRTMHWRGISEYGGQYIDVRGGWESQQFRVNFTWNFGNQQMKTREKKEGSEDLNKRVE
ncbi:MAG: TonB-dependent receptor [Crocinitomicaceae bacterium]|nr:TonB-dependent receptor [Crocinitomicaceae bacterium]